MSVWFTVTPLLCGEALLGLDLFPPPLARVCWLEQAAFCGRTSCCARGPHPLSRAQGGGLALLSLQIWVALWRALKCPCRAGWAAGRAGLAALLSPVSVAWRPGRCCHPAVGTPELSVQHGAVLSRRPGWLLSSFFAPRCAEPGPALCRLPGP